MARSNNVVNLFTSQGSIDLGSSEPPFFTGESSEVPTVKERRKWSTKEDLILIGAWLNTSKDPIVCWLLRHCPEGAGSGHNDNDVMKKALDIFANDQGSKFNFEHVWRELRHDAKWCSTFLEKEKRKPADSQADGEGAVPEPEPEERPIGVKAAKKRKKNGKEEELGKLQNLMELKKQISQQSLLAKPEPLSDMESALKLKFMSEFL
ncbi:hypothetical protein Bca4012_083103 [Brassica carinata]